MTAIIWKYTLAPVEKQTLALPKRSTLLRADKKGGEFCLWAFIADRNAEKEDIIIRIIGTGHEIEEPISLVPLGTIIDEPYVWHVFREIPYSDMKGVMNIQLQQERFYIKEQQP